MARKDDGKGSKRSQASKVGASASRGSAKSQAKAGKTGPAVAGRKRRRKAPKAVKKPFPVGFAAAVSVLVLLLGAILVYAATNVGSGLVTALDKADDKFDNLRVDDNLSAGHTDPFQPQRVAYPNDDIRPPDGGNHNPFWYKCAAYNAPIVNEHAVHSLEHGAVWITYRTDLPGDQVDFLTDLVAGNDYALLSPYPGQVAPVMATAWGRQLSAQNAKDDVLARFLRTYSNGPQTREIGAGCAETGQITLPGQVPYIPAAGENFVPGPDDTPTISAEAPVPEVSGRPTQLGGDPSAVPGVSGAPSPAPSGEPAATPAPEPKPAGTP